MTVISKTMHFGGVAITASKGGGLGGLLGALGTGLLFGGGGYLLVSALGSTADGLASANAAMESAIGVVFSAVAMLLLGAAGGLGVWWIASTPRRRQQAADVAGFRQRQAIAGQHARRSVAAPTCRELPTPAPIQAQAVRVDELEGVRER